MEQDGLLARILRQRGHQLVEHAADRLGATGKGAPQAGAGQPHSGEGAAPRLLPTLARQVAGVALMRVATRSVPGALLVGGGLLAKHLHEKRKAARDQAPATPGTSARPARS